jgi:hypothetical protein
VPSLKTIISREVLWRIHRDPADLQTRAEAATEYCVNYGVTDALSAFPLHSLVRHQ